MTHPSPRPASLAGVSAVKLALMAKQAHAQLDAIVRAEPVAIVGMACRFPGGADTPDAYWQRLRDGVDAVRNVPHDRWDGAAYYDRDAAMPGKMMAREGGFLDRIDLFDAAFFGILRREAEQMDPQHRLFLEVATDALEHAGLARERLAGSATGVFIASYFNDYQLLQLGDPESIDERTLTGSQHSVLANRLSYLLDLRGPSVSIDTACSSSLVAVHVACQSLRMGESRTAIAGGVSLMISPEVMISLSKVGFMSPTGRCRTFDALADGFIRGEGCGVVVLKRLSDAIADQDRILSVIRGSAVNQDGRSTVLSAPNGLAQQALIREALGNAQISPERVGFVETHGTGTPLGDPIEVEALAATLGAPRSDGSRCYLGSVKANLGHLEAAAGVAGLIKATLVMQHGEIPRQLHFTTPNPHLSIDGTCLTIADRHRAWPAGPTPRVAGVSGFGVGGTNAHVVLEEAPVLPAVDADEARDEPQLVAVSAQSPAALHAFAAKWVDFAAATPESLASVAATAGARRSHYDHRLAVVARTKEHLAAQLDAFVRGDEAAGVVIGRRPRGGAARIAFVFSGQGPQWARMGLELAAREPAFGETLADLDARFRRVAGWSVADAIAEPEECSRLQDTEVAQPAVFAIQVALASLWRAWGVSPDLVVGHSVGEIAALHVAGMLSLDDALRVVWHRGRIMQRATGHGRMMAAGLTAAEAEAVVRQVGPDLSLAAINAPRSVVLSGTAQAIEQALALLDTRGISHRALPVSYAFHSAQMAPFEAELVKAVGSIAAEPGHCAVYSTVTGEAIDSRDINAQYFGRNVRQPVRFATSIAAMLDAHVDAFVEIAPHPVLGASIAECLAGRESPPAVLASMRRGRAERETMLQACAGVYAVGRTPQWEALMPTAGSPVELPSYPWQRERYWLPAPVAPVASRRHSLGTVHPLLGDRGGKRSDGAVEYDGAWPTPRLTWVADHQVGGRVVMPAAGLLEALRAAAALEGRSLIDFVVERPMVFDDAPGEGMRWQTIASPVGDQYRVELSCAVGAETHRIAAATTAAQAQHEAIDSGPLASVAWQSAADSLYDTFAELGVRFGPSFRRLERWRVADDVGEGWLGERAGMEHDGEGLHVTALDAALQLCTVVASTRDGTLPSALLLPIAVESYTQWRRMPERVRAVVRAKHTEGGASVVAAIRFFDADGEAIAALDGVRFAPVNAAALAAFSASDAPLYQIGWELAERKPVVSPDDLRGAWIVLGDESETSRAIVRLLAAGGGRCLEVRCADATGRDGESRRTVPAFDGDALRAVLAEDAWRKGEAVRGIVHAWSLGADQVGDDDARGDWLTSGSALAVVQAIGASALRDVPLWIVTRGAQPVRGSVGHARQAGVWGFAAVAPLEMPDLRLHVVDLDESASAVTIDALFDALRAPASVPPRLGIRDGAWYVPRLQRYVGPDTSMPPYATLTAARPGTFDGLVWQPASRRAPGRNEVRVRVLAAGLNFRDVLLALGMYPGRVSLGAECAGVVEAVGEGVSELSAGDPVFGLAKASFATEVTVPARFLARVPAGVTVEDAAALPVAFLTAMLGLQELAGITRGSRVLIHAAAGGVGLAAVQVAQRRGAEVYATAGSGAKRDLLHSLGVRHVFDSRSLRFADDVLAATDGAGVDVVLNSLAGDFIPAGLRALAEGGWFLELGKREIWTPEQVAASRPDVHYRAYDLGEMCDTDAALAPRLLAELCAALGDGSLRPLPVRQFALGDARDAFRFMAQAKHVGKLVLSVSASRGSGAGSLVRSEATYWITGGAGAIGVRTARWLVDKGARHIVLTGRHAPAGEAQQIIDECIAIGARVCFRIADASDRAAMIAVRDEIGRSMPPLRGVVHAAGALDDGMLVHQTWDRWRAVLRGKAGGARILDSITRELPLDFFVLYSAAGLLLGPIGQGAYAAANAELDAIAWARRAAGLPGLSVAWGRWQESGMSARLAGSGIDPWGARGLGWISSRDGFEQLERLLGDGIAHAAILRIDWSRFLEQLPAGVDPDLYRAVTPVRRVSAQAASSPREDSVVTRWHAAPASERRSLVLAHVADRARQILDLGKDVVIDATVPLKEVGLDSLMAVELRNVLTRSLGTSLPATLLFDYPSLDALASYLVRTLSLTPDAPAAPAPSRADADAVAALSDQEAEALLLAELEGATRPHPR